MSSIISLCFTILVILVYTDVVCCKWCTNMVSEEHTYTITEASKCLGSYKKGCGWIFFSKCTYYEITTCFKEHNKTVMQYKIVEECCPGYELDPANNVTCLKKSDDPALRITIATPHNQPELEEVTFGSNFTPDVRLSVSGIDENQTRKIVHKILVKDRNYTAQYYKSEDKLLFGLSHGAHAGIICLFLFMFSVLILVLVHIIKRKQKSTVAKADVSTGCEMIEKMMPAEQA